MATKQKNKGGGSIFLILILFIFGMEYLPSLIRNCAYKSGFYLSFGTAKFIAFLCITVFAGIILVSKKKKADKKGQYRTSSGYTGPEEVKSKRIIHSAGIGDTKDTHSHDRLTEGFHHAETGLEHWKIQLDGFLKAGLIDKNEYRVLLERYRKEL